MNDEAREAFAKAVFIEKGCRSGSDDRRSAMTDRRKVRTPQGRMVANGDWG